MVDVPSLAQVHERLEQAIRTFARVEHVLIALDPSERSLTHRLAIHIEAEFPAGT
jgi:hypothetical protein